MRPLSDGVRERERERGETERRGDRERDGVRERCEAGERDRVRPRDGLREGIVRVETQMYKTYYKEVVLSYSAL